MLRRLLWFVVLLLVLGSAGLVYVSTQKVQAPESTKVAYGNIERLARGAGRVEGAGEPVTLSFATPGFIQELLAEEGKELDPENNVAKLDSSELDMKIAHAQAILKQASAKLDLVKRESSPELITQAEEKLKQVAKEVQAAESRLRALEDPPSPSPGTDYEIKEAERNIERAKQRLELEKAAFDRLKNTPSPDEKAIAEANVALAREKFDGAQKLYESVKPTFLSPSFQKVQMEVNVELAKRELQRAEAERDRIIRGPSSFEIAAAEAQLKLAQLAVDSAVAAKERLEKPPPPSRAPQNVITEAQYAVEQLKARHAQECAAVKQLKRGADQAEITAAEAAKEQAEMSHKLLNELYKEGLKLRAPFAGLVVKRHAAAGMLVPAFSPIVTIVDFSQRRVRAEFDVSRLGEIKPGQAVTLTSKAFKETAGQKESLEGKVERVVSVGTRRVFIDDPAATKGGEVVEVLIVISEPKKKTLKREAYDVLLPGLRMDTAVTLDRREHVLRIPKTYVANDGKEYVLLKKHGGDQEKRYITTGLRDEAWVQIEEGVADGDEIVKPEPQSRR